MQQIIAFGGGGFSSETSNLRLERYLLAQANKDRPKICFLPQASAEAPEYITAFYQTFDDLGAEPSWQSFFGNVTSGWEARLLQQDIIYVGGGNTRTMLAIWREWGVDNVLRQALANGVILSGLSAGAICWFEQGVTDSVLPLAALDCLGFLPGSCCPHYDGEPDRRPAYLRMVKNGAIKPGLALCDGVGAHFVDGELKQVITARPSIQAYHVEAVNGDARETAIEAIELSEG